MSRRRYVIAGFASVGLFCFASTLEAEKFYTFKAPCDFVYFCTETGETTPIKQNTGVCLEAFSPNLGLFAAAELTSCGMHMSANHLVNVNPSTGDISVVGAIGWEDVDAITWACDGRLLGISNGPSPWVYPVLIQISPTTGAGTEIGPVGVPFVESMAVSPSPGCAIYATSQPDYAGPSTLITIDPGTGAGTTIGAIGFDTVTGMAFDSNGVLWGITNEGEVITINPSTGAGTLQVDIATTAGFDGLSFAGTCPRPIWGEANAEASVYGAKAAKASTVLNNLSFLFIPIGAIIFMMFFRRKK